MFLSLRILWHATAASEQGKRAKLWPFLEFNAGPLIPSSLLKPIPQSPVQSYSNTLIGSGLALTADGHQSFLRRGAPPPYCREILICRLFVFTAGFGAGAGERVPVIRVVVAGR